MGFSRISNLFSVGLLSLFVTASGFAAAAAAAAEQKPPYKLRPTRHHYGYVVQDDHRGVFFGPSVEEVYGRASGSTGPLSICELGAGTGEFLKALLTENPTDPRQLEYTAVELNGEYHAPIEDVFKTLSLNRQSVLQIEKERPSLEQFLSHNQIQYDVIAAFQVLHFVFPRHLPVVLSQIYDSLKPEGVFLGSIRLLNPGLDEVSYDRAMEQRLPWASAWYYNIGEAASGRSDQYNIFPSNMHWPIYFMMGCKPDAWRELLEAVGFKVEVCEKRRAPGVHKMETWDGANYFDVIEHTWISFVASKKGAPNQEKVQQYIDTAETVQAAAKNDLKKKGIPLPSNW